MNNLMNNLDIVFKIFDLRLYILQERYKNNDIDANTYGFQLSKIDNELRDVLDDIKEEKDE